MADADAREPASAPPDPAPRSRRWGPFLLLAGLLVLADQTTKYLAVAGLTDAFEDRPVDTLAQRLSAFFEVRHPARMGQSTVFSWWQHVYAENTGAAFSLGAALPEGLRRGLFITVTLLALAGLALYHHRLAGSQRWNRVALALITGGAVGNLLDRVVRGYVVDFIDWHLADPGWRRPHLHWATFNVADAGIVLGVVMVFIDGLRHPSGEALPEPSAEDDAARNDALAAAVPPRPGA